MAKQKPEPRDPQEPSFEEALRQLEGIVRQLEEGELGLDEALARYEDGVKLLRRCHQLLEQAERRIELLSGVDAEGNPICTPLEDPSLPLDEKAKQRSRRRSSPSHLLSGDAPESGDEDTAMDEDGSVS